MRVCTDTTLLPKLYQTNVEFLDPNIFMDCIRSLHYKYPTMSPTDTIKSECTDSLELLNRLYWKSCVINCPNSTFDVHFYRLNDFSFSNFSLLYVNVTGSLTITMEGRAACAIWPKHPRGLQANNGTPPVPGTLIKSQLATTGNTTSSCDPLLQWTHC